MFDPTRATLSGISAALDDGRTSAGELLDACLDRIDRFNPKLNCFIDIDRSAAALAAAATDARLADGGRLGPLDGVPVAVKTNIAVRGLPVSAGIKARAEMNAIDDAFVVTRLRTAGAVIVGTLNMEEGALGATTNNPWYGACYNPYGDNLTPGGSSGGSGAAVAAGLVPAALGTDTMGSVRIPSAYCGVAGIKPSRGIVSTDGVVPLSWTLDTVGPLARSARDLGVLLEVMVGTNPEDADSVAAPYPSYQVADATSLTGMTVGRIREIDSYDGMAEEVRGAYLDALRLMERLGAAVRQVSLRGYDLGVVRRAGLMVSEAEGALFHDRLLASDPDGFSGGFRAMLEYGGKAPAVRLVAAQRRIAEAALAVRRAFDGVDVLVLPTTPSAAFSFDDPAPDSQADFTALANVAGLPAVSVPMGLGETTHLPIGLQVVAPMFREKAALTVAVAYEQAAGWTLFPEALD